MCAMVFFFICEINLSKSFFPCSRLQSGWSVKTAHINQWKQPEPISTDEHDKILQVIEKAEAMERAEMQRVG